MVFNFHLFQEGGRRLSFAYQGQLKHLRAAFDLRKLGLRRITFTFGLLISMESNQTKIHLTQLRKEKKPLSNLQERI